MSSVKWALYFKLCEFSYIIYICQKRYCSKTIFISRLLRKISVSLSLSNYQIRVLWHCQLKLLRFWYRSCNVLWCRIVGKMLINPLSTIVTPSENNFLTNRWRWKMRQTSENSCFIIPWEKILWVSQSKYIISSLSHFIDNICINNVYQSSMRGRKMISNRIKILPFKFFICQKYC